MFSNRGLRLAVKARVWKPTHAEWNLAAQSVQVEEKERIGKFVFKRDAKMAMVGRLVMRFAVSKVLAVPSRCLQFGRTDKGKPYLMSPVDRITPRCDLNFNLSHQGDYVVFASDREHLIGVDVMKIEWPRNKPISDFFNNMRRQLTPYEWKEVESRSGDMQQLKTFYRLWCLKESLVKALGTGIGFEVGRLEFHFQTPELMPDHVTTDTQVKIDGVATGEWSFEETMLEDHCVAVALRKDNKKESQTNADTGEGEPGIFPSPPSFSVMGIQELLSQSEPLAGSTPDELYWQAFDRRQEDPDHR